MTTVNPLIRSRPRLRRKSPIPPSQNSTSARAAFGSGDYAGALQLTDEALKVLPNDATLHEFRALVLFAVGKYDLAAGPLYAVLSVGPGWDWTTMAGLYPNIDVYTSQLRKLEAFVSANPKSTAGHFVLAYHYLTQGHTEEAVSQLKQVVALAPQDTLCAQLVKQFSPPRSHPAAGAVHCDGTGCHTRQAGESGRETGPPTRPAIRRSTCTSGTTRPSPGRSPPRASPGNSPGNGHSPTTCSRWRRKGTEERWSAVSPGKPTTSGASAARDRARRPGDSLHSVRLSTTARFNSTRSGPSRAGMFGLHRRAPEA